MRKTVEDLNLEEPYKSLVFKTLLERQLGGIGFAETQQLTGAMDIASTPVAFAVFAKEKNPQTHQEKALTVAYYLWKFENRNFTFSDIELYCQKVAWPTYSNPSVLMKQLKSEGYIEPLTKTSKGEMEYRIIQPGIEVVENGFKKEA